MSAKVSKIEERNKARGKERKLEQMKENLAEQKERKNMRKEKKTQCSPHLTPNPFNWTINLPSSPFFPSPCPSHFHNHHVRPVSF
jgi:hypothetical protein